MSFAYSFKLNAHSLELECVHIYKKIPITAGRLYIYVLNYGTIFQAYLQERI